MQNPSFEYKSHLVAEMHGIDGEETFDWPAGRCVIDHCAASQRLSEALATRLRGRVLVQAVLVARHNHSREPRHAQNKV